MITQQEVLDHVKENSIHGIGISSDDLREHYGPDGFRVVRTHLAQLCVTGKLQRRMDSGVGFYHIKSPHPLNAAAHLETKAEEPVVDTPTAADVEVKAEVPTKPIAPLTQDHDQDDEDEEWDEEKEKDEAKSHSAANEWPTPPSTAAKFVLDPGVVYSLSNLPSEEDVHWTPEDFAPSPLMRGSRDAELIGILYALHPLQISLQLLTSIAQTLYGKRHTEANVRTRVNQNAGFADVSRHCFNELGIRASRLIYRSNGYYPFGSVEDVDHALVLRLQRLIRKARELGADKEVVAPAPVAVKATTADEHVHIGNGDTPALFITSAVATVEDEEQELPALPIIEQASIHPAMENALVDRIVLPEDTMTGNMGDNIVLMTGTHVIFVPRSVFIAAINKDRT